MSRSDDRPTTPSGNDRAIAADDAGLGAQLGEAIRRRVESDPVVVPALDTVITRRAEPRRRRPPARWAAPAVAAAAAAVIGVAGATAIVGNDDDIDRLDATEVTNPDPITTSTGRSTTTTIEPAPARVTIPPVTPIEDGVDVPQISARPELEWTEVPLPDSVVSGGGMELLGSVGDRVVIGTFDRGLSWSADDGWTPIDLPEGHRLLPLPATDPEAPIAVTVGTDEDTWGTWIWTLDPERGLVDPFPLRLPDLPDLAEDHLVAQGVNEPVVAGTVDELIVARSYIPRLDLPGLLVERGYLTDDDIFCDVRGDADVLSITVSAAARTDGECFSVSDRRTFAVTAADLGVPPADFALEMGVPGEDRTRTVIYVVDEGEVVPVREIPGMIHQIAIGELGTIVAAAAPAGGTELSFRPVDSDRWIDRSIPGTVVLSSGDEFGVAITEYDGRPVLHRLAPDGAELVGLFPEPTWQVVFGGWTRPGPATAFMVDTDPDPAIESWAVVASTSGDSWAWTVPPDDAGHRLADVVVAGGRLVLHAISVDGSGDRLLVAPLPDG